MRSPSCFQTESTERQKKTNSVPLLNNTPPLTWVNPKNQKDLLPLKLEVLSPQPCAWCFPGPGRTPSRPQHFCPLHSGQVKTVANPYFFQVKGGGCGVTQPSAMHINCTTKELQTNYFCITRGGQHAPHRLNPHCLNPKASWSPRLPWKAQGFRAPLCECNPAASNSRATPDRDPRPVQRSFRTGHQACTADTAFWVLATLMKLSQTWAPKGPGN